MVVSYIFIFYIFIFLVSCFALSWGGTKLVKTLIEIAEYLHLREFIVGFFVMAIAASLPNFFVDINAALHKISGLSLGDVIGGNIVDLTLVLALAVFFSGGKLLTDSQMVQGSTIFTSALAVLPVLFILTGKITRVDGLILIFAFFVYSYWLFSKEERFKKIYSEDKIKDLRSRFAFLKTILTAAALLCLLILSSYGIIYSAQFFAQTLVASISVIGLLIIGLGNCFPETYFSIISARKEENWMILGDIMGSIVICATLDLGLVALINPIQGFAVSSFNIAAIFTVLAAIVFWTVIKTGKTITKKEGILLLSVYIVFLLSEIFIKF